MGELSAGQLGNERGQLVNTPNVDWYALSPELALLATAAVCLLAAALLPPGGRRPFSAFIAAAGFVTAGVFAVLVFHDSESARTIVNNAAYRDQLAAFAQVLIAGCGLLGVGVAYTHRLKPTRVAEFYALLATAAAGMMFMVAAGNLMTLFLGLEWFSITLYILCALDLDRPESLEAGAQVPDRRQLRFGRAPLRLGARVRLDAGARVLARSPPQPPRRTSPATRCSWPAWP